MYVVTFYSFKGGVGRSMSMVNVALQLAKKGRSVLLVDFDLEAPGLDAFLRTYGVRPHRGVVDFVTDYRMTGRSPDVADYIYQIGSGSSPKAWYMPSGRRGDGYGARLNAIDWQQLYQREDGFLLFEDLKAQWRDTLQPDYVFIDSRTGHTDVSGICTRQLPDAVTLMFRLDEQNLEGLVRVVQDIRAESRGPRKKNIVLHFVPSNVPRIDDEHGVIAEQIGLFQKRLQFRRPAAQIHHYEDLEMLKHSLFTLTRGNTRIAKEYVQLANEIIRHNLEDVEGARSYLEQVTSGRTNSSAEDIDARISTIASRHPHDPVVVKLLADVYQTQGKTGQAVAYLTEAINTGATEPEYLIRRAELNHALGNTDDARADLRAVLANPVEDYFAISKLANLARQVDDRILRELPKSKAIQSLNSSTRRAIAIELRASESEAWSAIQILQDLLADESLSEGDQEETRTALALPLIALRRFAEVTELLADAKTIEDAFNFGMARWGQTGAVPRFEMEEVVRLYESNHRQANRQSANYEFCIAIAMWAAGRGDDAQIHIGNAKQIARGVVGTDFSPWSYRDVGVGELLSDLEQAESMIEGQPVRPACIAPGKESEIFNA